MTEENLHDCIGRNCVDTNILDYLIIIRHTPYLIGCCTADHHENLSNSSSNSVRTHLTTTTKWLQLEEKCLALRRGVAKRN